MSEQRLNLFQKLLEVKKVITYLKKDKDSYQYSYASGEAVLGAINPELNIRGVFLKSEVLEVKTQVLKTGTRMDKNLKQVVDKFEVLYDVSMLFTFIDTETGEKDENRWHGSGINGEEKGYGSALTYAERYFFLKYFNIATGRDDPDSRQEKPLTEAETKEIEVNQRKITLDGWIDNCITLNMLAAVYKNMTPQEQNEYKDRLKFIKDDIVASMSPDDRKKYEERIATKNQKQNQNAKQPKQSP